MAAEEAIVIKIDDDDDLLSTTEHQPGPGAKLKEKYDPHTEIFILTGTSNQPAHSKAIVTAENEIIDLSECISLSDDEDSPPSSKPTGPIILGSKISKLSLKAKVYLEDCSEILNANPLYCELCQILFPSSNEFDLHDSTYHCHLVAKTKCRSQNVFKVCEHCHTCFDDINYWKLHKCKSVKTKKINKDIKRSKRETVEIGVKRNKETTDADKVVERKRKRKKEEVNNLLHKKSVPNVYSCPICSVLYKYLSYLKEHISGAHRMTFDNFLFAPFKPQCKFCHIKTNVLYHNKHIMTYHNQLWKKIVTDPVEKLSYEESVKAELGEACDKLSKANKIDLTVNVSEFSKTNAKRCKPKSFVGEGSKTTINVKYIPKDVVFECQKCSVNFVSTYIAACHVIRVCNIPNELNTHSQFYKCPKCYKIFRKKDRSCHESQHKAAPEIKTHEFSEKIYDKVLFKCDRCHVYFEQLALSIHRNKGCRNMKPRQKCTICGVFVNVDHIQKHLNDTLAKSDFIFIDETISSKSDESKSRNDLPYDEPFPIIDSKPESSSKCYSNLKRKICSNTSEISPKKTKTEIMESIKKQLPKLLYNCKSCHLMTDSYDHAVEHSQKHISVDYYESTLNTCKICFLKYDTICKNNHEEDPNTKILIFDYAKLLDDEWYDLFASVPKDEVEKIKSASKFVTRALKMNVKFKKLSLSIYRCEVCLNYVDPPSVYFHSQFCDGIGGNHACKDCGIKFSSTRGLDNHKKLHQRPNISASSFSVISFNDKADKVFNMKLELFSMLTKSKDEADENHTLDLESVNYINIFQCRKCKSCSSDTSFVKSHQKCNEHVQKCIKCDFYTQETNMSNHLEWHETNLHITTSSMRIIPFENRKLVTYEQNSRKLYPYFECRDCNMLFVSAHDCGKLLSSTCVICKYIFSPWGLILHMQNHKDDMRMTKDSIVVIPCLGIPEVKAVTPQPSDRDVEIIVNEIEIVHSDTMYKCASCKCVFATKNDFCNHHRAHLCLANNGDKCQKCNLVFHENAIELHKERHSLIGDDVRKLHKIVTLNKGGIKDYTLYKCAQCNIHFVNRAMFHLHLKRDHINSEVVACRVCKLKFESSTIDIHIKLHHDVENYKAEDFYVIGKYERYRAQKDLHFGSKSNHLRKSRSEVQKKYLKSHRVDNSDSKKRSLEVSVSACDNPDKEITPDTKDSKMSEKKVNKPVFVGKIGAMTSATRYNSVFVCLKCSICFLSLASIYLHFEINHVFKKKDIKQCSCGLVFNKGSIYKHKDIHHKKIKYYVEDLHQFLAMDQNEPNNSAYLPYKTLSGSDEWVRINPSDYINNDIESQESLPDLDTKFISVNSGIKMNTPDTALENRIEESDKHNTYTEDSENAETVKRINKPKFVRKVGPNTRIARYNSVYVCLKCQLGFLTLPSINLHFEKNHTFGRAYTKTCACGLRFSRQSIKKHKDFHHRRLKYDIEDLHFFEAVDDEGNNDAKSISINPADYFENYTDAEEPLSNMNLEEDDFKNLDLIATAPSDEQDSVCSKKENSELLQLQNEQSRNSPEKRHKPSFKVDKTYKTYSRKSTPTPSYNFNPNSSTSEVSTEKPVTDLLENVTGIPNKEGVKGDTNDSSTSPVNEKSKNTTLIPTEISNPNSNDAEVSSDKSVMESHDNLSIDDVIIDTVKLHTAPMPDGAICPDNDKPILTIKSTSTPTDQPNSNALEVSLDTAVTKSNDNASIVLVEKSDKGDTSNLDKVAASNPSISPDNENTILATISIMTSESFNSNLNVIEVSAIKPVTESHDNTTVLVEQAEKRDTFNLDTVSVSHSSVSVDNGLHILSEDKQTHRNRNLLNNKATQRCPLNLPSLSKKNSSLFKLFKCSACNVHFLEQNACIEHVSNHTPLDAYDYLECKFCNLQFEIDYLKTHMRNHHGGKNFELNKVLIEEYVLSEKGLKTNVYYAVDKVQSLQVSTTTDESKEKRKHDDVSSSHESLTASEATTTIDDSELPDTNDTHIIVSDKNESALEIAIHKQAIQSINTVSPVTVNNVDSVDSIFRKDNQSKTGTEESNTNKILPSIEGNENTVIKINDLYENTGSTVPGSPSIIVNEMSTSFVALMNKSENNRTLVKDNTVENEVDHKINDILKKNNENIISKNIGSSSPSILENQNNINVQIEIGEVNLLVEGEINSQPDLESTDDRSGGKNIENDTVDFLGPEKIHQDVDVPQNESEEESDLLTVIVVEDKDAAQTASLVLEILTNIPIENSIKEEKENATEESKDNKIIECPENEDKLTSNNDSELNINHKFNTSHASESTNTKDLARNKDLSYERINYKSETDWININTDEKDKEITEGNAVINISNEDLVDDKKFVMHISESINETNIAENTELTETRYSCSFCNESFKNNLIKDLHESLEHLDAMKECDICNTSFNMSILNELHLNIRDEEFVCCICSCKYKISDLINHSSTHKVKNEFK